MSKSSEKRSKTKRRWIPLFAMRPTAGVVVETKIDYGQGARSEAELVRDGDLWFLPDKSKCIHYSPTHWRKATYRNG